MKEEFTDLLTENLDDRYCDFLTNNELKGIIKSQTDPLSREMHLQDFMNHRVKNSDLNEYANPFYIGFGNPNSKILVIGKEKAFDSSLQSNLLIKESINNFLQWKYIFDNKVNWQNQREICDLVGFNPLNPKVFHKDFTKRSHTWGITSLIIKSAIDERIDLQYNDEQKFVNSIFSRCFFTELNHRPAKNKGKGTTNLRREFLKANFFKSFPVVIFSAKTYLGGKIDILKELFNIKEEFKEIKIQKQRNSVKLYKSENQSVFVCNQLSGSCGWSNSALDLFGKEIKKVLV